MELRGTEGKVSCPRTQHSKPGHDLIPDLDLESNRLTIRPPCMVLKMFQQHWFQNEYNNCICFSKCNKLEERVGRFLPPHFFHSQGLSIQVTHPFCFTKNLSSSFGCLVCCYASHHWFIWKLWKNTWYMKDLRQNSPYCLDTSYIILHERTQFYIHVKCK